MELKLYRTYRLNSKNAQLMNGVILEKVRETEGRLLFFFKCTVMSLRRSFTEIFVTRVTSDPSENVRPLSVSQAPCKRWISRSIFESVDL